MVRDIEPQKKTSIEPSVHPLDWDIASSCSALKISDGIYGHTIVTGPAIKFLCTGPITFRGFMTKRR